MKSPIVLRSAVSLAAWLLGAAAMAQPAPAAPAPDAGPGARQTAAGPAGPASIPRPSRPPAPPLADAGTPVDVTGRVERWLPNPNGEVDGLLLEDGTQVTFPPHLSASLVAAVKLHDTVQITGRSGQTARLIRAHLIRNSRSGGTVSDQAPDGAAPPAPRDRSALAPMTANGRIATLLHTGRGDIDGVLLDDGTVVRFPPNAGGPFGDTLKPNGTLFAQGYGTRSPQGSALEATRIGSSADAAQAVFQGPHGPAGEPPRPQAEGRPLAPPTLPSTPR